VLNITVDRRARLLHIAVPNIARKLQTLADVGPRLHPDSARARPRFRAAKRSASKLALEAAAKRGTPAAPFYILEEPTTGLHLPEHERLLRDDQLREPANTIVVTRTTSSHQDRRRSSTWGPKGETAAAQVVAEGTARSRSRGHPASFHRALSAAAARGA